MGKLKYKTLAIALALGLLMVVIDNILDYYFFYQHIKFIDLLLFNIPGRELYNRLTTVLVFMIFGLLAWRYILKIDESEGRYCQLFDNVNDGVFVTTRSAGDTLKFIEVNAVACKSLGYSKQELLNLSPEVIIEPGELQDRPALSKKIEVDKHIVFETVLRSKNGNKIPVEVNSHRFHLSGRPIVLSIVRDITVRKEAEKRLRESARQLRILAARLLNLQDRERSRISKELHDEVGQTMMLLKFQLSAIHEKLTDNSLQNECDEVLKHIDDAIENIRRLAKDLSPTSLENLGLSAAVRFLMEDFSKSSNIEAATDIDEVDDLLPPQVQLNIYRIFQEALTNIGRHAQARRVSAAIKKRAEGIYIMIQDDGKGFNVPDVFSNHPKVWGFGLATMKERVQLIGGSLDLVSQPGSGTKITFTVPVGGGIENGPLSHLAGR